MAFDWLISFLLNLGVQSQQDNIIVLVLLIFNKQGFEWIFVTWQQDNFLLCMGDGKQLITFWVCICYCDNLLHKNMISVKP